MRVVIDTNVFVSGVFWKGSPAAILEAWRDGHIEMVLSPAILDEYHRVGAELNRCSADHPERWSHSSTGVEGLLDAAVR